MRPELTGASLHIDLDALIRNWRRFAAAAEPGRAGACVKADGYGLGMIPVARALWGAGCHSFFVAFPAEGITLRQEFPEAEILVLNGLLAGTAADYAAHALTPMLAQPAELSEWAAFCRSHGKRLPAGLDVDTGMNRLGFSRREIEAISPADLEGIEVSLVMSHLSHADEPYDGTNLEQLARFRDLVGHLPPARLSLANSAGSLLGPEFTMDLVRPGVGVYGGNPFGMGMNEFETVARLTAPVLQVREVAEGERVGYSGTFTARKPGRIAIIGVGYRDGYPRALSSSPEGGPARVYLAGHSAPLAGRVSMDMIAVDVTAIPAHLVTRGTVAELLGDQVTLEELARLSGTISYEILTRLGSRHARIYSGGDSITQGASP